MLKSFYHLLFISSLLVLTACNPLGTGELLTGENYRPGYVLIDGVSLKSLPHKLRGNELLQIGFSISSEIQNPKLLVSFDSGENFIELASLSSEMTNYPWSIPTDHDGEIGVLKLEGHDSQGKVFETFSNEFVIDSVAPDAPEINLLSSVVTNSLNVNLGIASCVDRAFILLSESSDMPLREASGWRNCASLVNYVQSSSQGSKNIYVFAKDEVGNISSPGSVSLIFDTVPPSSPNITLTSAFVSNSLDTTLTVSGCSDIHSLIVAETNVTPALSDEGWTGCSLGAMSYQLQGSAQGQRHLYVWSRDSAGNISSPTHIERKLDQQPPIVEGVVINPSGPLDNIGDTYSGTANLTVRIRATDAISDFSLRVLEVSNLNTCEAQYTEGAWLAYSPQVSVTVAPLDGVKKICVWAKDEAGNKTVIGGGTPEALSVNMDTIIYEVGNIPQVVSFKVINKNDNSTDFVENEPAEISFSLEDEEGLNLNPVSISYTVDNTTWLDIHSGLDSSIPTNVTWFGSMSTVEKSYSGTYDFPAPSSGYFKFRITAKDRAGNTSVAIYSDAMNGSPWSIYAGNTDVGNDGTALAARFKTANGSVGHFAISPKTNDLYVLDRSSPHSIRKLDSRTGLVTNFITHGTTNITNNATLPDSILISTPTSIKFDNEGALYVAASNTLWKIDLEANKSYSYVPSSRWVGQSAFTFDEENSLYYFEKCTNGKKAVRIMKLTQENGLPKDFIHIAGNCEEGTPSGNGPLDPREMPLGTTYSSGVANAPMLPLSSLVVMEKGKYIFYHYYYGNGANKILNGQWYKSNLPAAIPTGYFYNQHTQKFYGTDLHVREYFPNLTGANGDTVGAKILIPNSNSGECGIDDIPYTEACVNSGLGADTTSSGVLLFGDGGVQNSPGTYRIRYIDPVTQKIKTLAGSMPFYGDKLSKELVRGDLSGIHYKETSSPGFPAGLYFMDYSALVLGRIDPVTQKVNLMFGDQTMRGVSVADQGEVSKATSLGNSYSGGNGRSLMFDENGNPWFRGSQKLYSIAYDAADEKHLLVHRMVGGTGWGEAPDGANPKNYFLYVGGGAANLTGSSKGIFVIGVHTSNTGSYNRKPSIRYFDFENNTTRKIMGSPSSETPSSAPDSVDPDEIIKDLPVNCAYSDVCYLYYDRSEDTLYFRERSGNRLRYITNVLSSDPTVPKIHSISLTRNPGNFTFRPGHPNELYYTSGGKLYCKNITGIGCSDTTDLGPNPLIGSINSGGNQFAWIDSNTLLISGYNGVVFKYQLE